MSQLVAKYKFDKSIDANLIPVFDNNFVNYEIIDNQQDTENIQIKNYETELIMCYNAMPDENGVLTSEYEVGITINEVLAENIVTRYIYSDDNFSECSFRDKTGLLVVEHLQVTNKVSNMSYMFYNCTSLTEVNTSGWDTSKVSTMSYMFYKCEQLTLLNVKDFNTTMLSNANYMFRYCKSLKTLYLDQWDVYNLQRLNYILNDCDSLMFIYCRMDALSKLQSKLPTRSYDSPGCIVCIDFSGSFNMSILNQKYWIMRKYLIAQYTFDKSIYEDLMPQFNIDFDPYYEIIDDGIDTYNTQSANTGNLITRSIVSDELPTRVIFGSLSDDQNDARVKSLIELSVLDITNITDMSYMFNYCTNLTKVNCADWSTIKVTSMKKIFNMCKSLQKLDVFYWSMDKVVDMEQMCYGCDSITMLRMSNWKLNNNVSMTNFISGVRLEKIEISDASFETVNKVISALPTKSRASFGSLDISNVDDLSKVNIEEALLKYWNISGVPKIIRPIKNKSLSGSITSKSNKCAIIKMIASIKKT